MADRSIERDSVKLEEKARAGVESEPSRRPRGSSAVLPADDLEAARERRPLESYFQEIGGTRTLKREEEVILAKDLESATARARSAVPSWLWSSTTTCVRRPG